MTSFEPGSEPGDRLRSRLIPFAVEGDFSCPDEGGPCMGLSTLIFRRFDGEGEKELGAFM